MTYDLLKYFLVRSTTVPDNRNKAIKLGILIKPLKVSAMLHNNPRSTVAPNIDTKEYTTKNGFITLSLWNKNETNLEPYNPQPIIVEKAKQHKEIAVKIDAHPPYVEVNPEIVSSAPAATP